MKGNLWAWRVKTWLHWFSRTITMIKPCFNTELRVLSASPLPGDIPKINHKFTSQFPLWNCVRLQIPYQIIDRILFFTVAHTFRFYVPRVRLCERICTSFLIFFFFSQFLRVCFRGELMFTVPCHRNRARIFASHLSAFTGGSCLLDRPTSSRWSERYTLLPHSFPIPAKVAMLTCRSDPEYLCGEKKKASFHVQ